MAEPLHILKHEHRVIERALRALEGVCSRLEWGPSVPQDALSGIVNFLSTFANCYHHGKEETYLFPALERHGITRGTGPLGAMEKEHEIERRLTSEMVLAIQSYRDVDPTSRTRFVAAAHKYMTHLLSHIANEDSILFRIADELLDETEKAALFESFKEAESRLGHSSQDYDRIAAELEDRWGL
jgi:hemerythrin-like domain-containing protein